MLKEYIPSHFTGFGSPATSRVPAFERDLKFIVEIYSLEHRGVYISEILEARGRKGEGYYGRVRDRLEQAVAKRSLREERGKDIAGRAIPCYKPTLAGVLYAQGRVS